MKLEGGHALNGGGCCAESASMQKQFAELCGAGGCTTAGHLGGGEAAELRNEAGLRGPGVRLGGVAAAAGPPAGAAAAAAAAPRPRQHRLVHRPAPQHTAT